MPNERIWENSGVARTPATGDLSPFGISAVVFRWLAQLALASSGWPHRESHAASQYLTGGSWSAIIADRKFCDAMSSFAVGRPPSMVPVAACRRPPAGPSNAAVLHSAASRSRISTSLTFHIPCLIAVADNPWRDHNRPKAIKIWRTLPSPWSSIQGILVFSHSLADSCSRPAYQSTYEWTRWTAPLSGRWWRSWYVMWPGSGRLLRFRY